MNYPTRQSDSQIRIRRSVTRLLSLADRVEWSCFQFVLIRVFLLWLLRPAELRVRNNVFGMAEDFGIEALPGVFNVFEASDQGMIAHNSVDEALDLALRLRALAGLMAWMYGLDLIDEASADFFVENYRRHMRSLTSAFQSSARLKLIAARGNRLTGPRCERLEVRSGLIGCVGGRPQCALRSVLS